jgi:hypothetical protein
MTEYFIFRSKYIKTYYDIALLMARKVLLDVNAAGHDISLYLELYHVDLRVDISD